MCLFACRSDFPELRTQGSRGSKTTPVKGALGGSLNRQKSIGGKPADYSLSSSASAIQSSSKGKKNASTKHSGSSLTLLTSFAPSKKEKAQ